MAPACCCCCCCCCNMAGPPPVQQTTKLNLWMIPYAIYCQQCGSTCETFTSKSTITEELPLCWYIWIKTSLSLLERLPTFGSRWYKYMTFTLSTETTPLQDNRVHRQSRFPTFIMAQRHYIRMSATRYQCSDQGENICDVSMVWLVAQWPIFWPLFDLQICSWMANPILHCH